MNGLSDNEVTEAEHQERSAHHYSVDCTRANTGLFVGIIVMVFTIISLIVFFVLIKDEKLKDTAITVASLTELSLYCITSVAVLIAMCQVIFSDFFSIVESFYSPIMERQLFRQIIAFVFSSCFFLSNLK